MAIAGLLPYITLFFIFLIKKQATMRENILLSSIIWAYLIVIVSEGLSLFHGISPTTLLFCWSIFSLSAFILALRNKVFIAKLRPTALTYLLIFITSIPLIIGFIYSPNNWDSMTYHLPRIEHWLQNGTIAHYPTSIDRQNALAPFAELIILQLRALSGSDILYNSVQWLAYIGSILNVSLIAKRLGATTRGQQIAALICATIPMAILQASSTQTDLVVSWWLSALAALSLIWWQESSRSSGIFFGAALGLACFTKGTAYPIAFPFVTFFAVHALCRPRKRLKIALCAALIALACNITTFTRNIETYGDIIGGKSISQTKAELNINNIVSNIICNIAINIEPRIPDNYFRNHLDSAMNFILEQLNIDNKKFFPYGEFSTRAHWSCHEDVAQNMLHTLLIILFFPLIFFNWNKICKIYTSCVIMAWVFFCGLIAWQPWITRLQLPLFILASAPIALALCKMKKTSFFILSMLTIVAICVNSFNISRPILKKGKNTVAISIQFDREKNYFANRSLLYEKYKKAVDNICKYKNIGVIIGGDSWEYPLFAMLKRRNCDNNISHIMNMKQLDNIDAIFFLDAICRFGICRPTEENPYVIEVKNLNK